MNEPFDSVSNGEVITPIMDDYLMKCCDCGLVHRFRFRAIQVKERLADGTFVYDELDQERFRVQLVAWRDEADKPQDPLRNAVEQFLASCKDGNVPELADYYEEIFTEALGAGESFSDQQHDTSCYDNVPAAGVPGLDGQTFRPADADDATKRNDDLIRLGRSSGK